MLNILHRLPPASVRLMDRRHARVSDLLSSIWVMRIARQLGYTNAEANAIARNARLSFRRRRRNLRLGACHRHGEAVAVKGSTPTTQFDVEAINDIMKIAEAFTHLVTPRTPTTAVLPAEACRKLWEAYPGSSAVRGLMACFASCPLPDDVRKAAPEGRRVFLPAVPPRPTPVTYLARFAHRSPTRVQEYIVEHHARTHHAIGSGYAHTTS